MTKALYTAEAHVTGGRIAGHGRTTDGALEVDLRVPPEMGGEGGGPTPSSSSRSATPPASRARSATVARRKKLEAGDVEIDSKVTLVTGEDRGFTIAVELDVTLPSLEGDDAVELVRAAHKVCPYSNATRGNIDMTLSANGVARRHLVSPWVWSTTSSGSSTAWRSGRRTFLPGRFGSARSS